MATETATPAAETKAPIKNKRKDLMSVHPSNLVVVEGFNGRIDYGTDEEMKDLMESIIENGLEVPLKAARIRGTEQYEIVDGHRRFRAIQMAIEAGHDIQGVDVQPYTGNAEDRVFSMLVTGTGQKSLNDVEQAQIIKTLLNMGYDAKQIKARIGKSLAQVYSLITISELPQKVKNLMLKRKITTSAVLAITRDEKDPEKQTAMVVDAIKNANNGIEVDENSTAPTKTATAHHVTNSKKKAPYQKIQEAYAMLEKEGIKNDKMMILEIILAKSKTGTVEELAAIIRGKDKPAKPTATTDKKDAEAGKGSKPAATTANRSASKKATAANGKTKAKRKTTAASKKKNAPKAEQPAAEAAAN